MRRPECLVVGLLFIVASCGDAGERRPSSVDRGTEAYFAEFARTLFAELRSEPLDSTVQLEIGLFGDLSVNTGERLVMGQYRYRVDSASNGPFGSMAFQIRDASRRYDPVPVVVTFAQVADVWQMETATFGHAASESPPHAAGDAVHDSLRQAPGNTAHDSLRQAPGDNAHDSSRQIPDDTAPDSPLHAPGDANQRHSDDSLEGDPETPLHQSLRTRLDAWIEAAVQRSEAGSIR